MATKSLWEQVMALKQAGQTEQQGGANLLTDDDIQTVCGTIDFFGGNWQQAYVDLSAKARPIAPRYRVFDFLAMCVQGRLGESVHSEQAVKVLVYSFLKVGGVPSKWIEDLQVTDYQMDTEWESLELTV